MHKNTRYSLFAIRYFGIAICYSLFAILVGCAVGPDYTRPHGSVPSKWRDQALADSSIAGMPYWSLYNDAVLQSYIKAALDSNLTILASMSRIKEAQAQITFTKADLYPDVSVNAGAGAFQLSKNRYPGFSPELLDGVRGAFGLGAVLNWELDIFGRVRRATEAQRALFAASEAAQRAAVVSTVSSVAETYISLRELDRLKEILDTNLVARKEYAKLAETLFKGGKTSELDFRQAEAELRRVEANVPIVVTAIAQTENALNVLIGRVPGTPVRRGTTLEAQTLPPTVPSGIPTALLERRPDVVMAEQELVAANAEIGVATAMLFPRITIGASAGWQSLNIDNLVSPSSVALQAGGELLQPIFNAGKNMARVDAADARMQQLMSNYSLTVLNSFRDVNDALTAYNNSISSVAATNASVASTRTVLRLSELRYRYGAAPYLQVLDAQRSLLEAQRTDINAKGDQYRALIYLYRALGGGY